MYKENLDGYALEQLWYFIYTNKMNYNFISHGVEKAIALNNLSIEHTPYSYFNKINKKFY